MEKTYKILKLLIWVLVFAVVIVGAYALYNRLGSEVQAGGIATVAQESKVQEETETLDETASETEDLDRGRLWETETPQAFPLGKILFAYERVCAENLTVTDDVSAFAVALDGRVALVENLSPNLKITAPADLVLAEAILNLSARTA